MIRTALIAALAATSLAAPAWADLTYISCQPDRRVDNGVAKTITDNQKRTGAYAYHFAYDMASGKACAINQTWKMCEPELWAVQPSTSDPADLFFTKRDSRGQLQQSLLTSAASGRFRAEVTVPTKPPSKYEFAGDAGACKPFTDFTVEMPK
jgi:hypothetical protein